MSSPVPLVNDNLRVLEQGFELLAKLGDAGYPEAEASLPGRGIGSQLRHVLEHYGCFLAGAASGTINYDARARDQRLATSATAAAEKLREISTALQGIEASALERPARVKMDSGSDPEGDAFWSQSTVKRELQFLLSHTVHHYALIALLLERRGLTVGAGFGIAPSTLRHWRENPECAPPAG